MNLDQLRDLEGDQNDGRGVRTVRTIIFELERNRLSDAKASISNDWDKIRVYPVIAQWFKDNGLAEQKWV